MEKEYEVITCNVEKVADKKRVLRFKGSDATKDRDNDIITTQGWDLTNYKKNPVFLLSHNYQQLQVITSYSFSILSPFIHLLV